MMAMEERLAHVEGLVAGQAVLLGDLRAAVTNLEVRMDRRFEQVENRFAQMDVRLDVFRTEVEARFNGLETKLEGKIDAAGQETRRELRAYFGWMMSGMMTLAAAALVAVLVR